MASANAASGRGAEEAEGGVEAEASVVETDVAACEDDPG
jgi:hypothetical protein